MNYFTNIATIYEGTVVPTGPEYDYLDPSIRSSEDSHIPSLGFFNPDFPTVLRPAFDDHLLFYLEELLPYLLLQCRNVANKDEDAETFNRIQGIYIIRTDNFTWGWIKRRITAGLFREEQGWLMQSAMHESSDGVPSMENEEASNFEGNKVCD
ncbi:hypothetical protein BJ508DRAFT_320868 [Ascobolus immersus RN42]|uniref:Uncharacterized protein n=1 Tax=Ascobolus immersus RN42 TaxID=1160509 RepID=A0A3N4IRW4_ASCIM|nr:hypothetical protein BJ508DRAFT_320868 [Ascobolus immersus RN42]